MRKKSIIFYTLLLSLCPHLGFAIATDSIVMQTYYHPIRTKEEFYSLYRENLHEKEDNFKANLAWLSYALTAPFDHPVKALAKIESEEQWKEYQTLFLFQIHFLMMQNYLFLGELYDKPHLYFFNGPFSEELNEGFQMAKIYYQKALSHLKEAQNLAKIAWDNRDNTPKSLGGELDKWADRMYRLSNTNYYHEINYEKEIDMRIQKADEKMTQLNSNSPSNKTN